MINIVFKNKPLWSLGQIEKRPFQHVSGRISLFRPHPTRPKTCLRACLDNCEHNVSIFIAFG